MSGNLADEIFMNTCLVIPCYNEANRIQSEAFVSALQINPNLQLVFVNDGSSDETLGVLTSFRETQLDAIRSRIHILSYNSNKGKSTAVTRGLHACYSTLINGTPSLLEAEEITCVGFDSIRADYLGFWDADLATPLTEVDWFYRFANIESTVENPLLIIGSRVARLGANIKRTLFRHYSGRVFATLISQGLGWKVHDTQCGAKLFKPELVPICFQEKFKTSWLFDVEILLRLQQHFGPDAENLVIEVPLRTWTDVEGSKIGWLDFLKVPYQIWQVFRAYK
jgi:glycosyltransferase involved in cell wall biosynthesis